MNLSCLGDGASGDFEIGIVTTVSVPHTIVMTDMTTGQELSGSRRTITPQSPTRYDCHYWAHFDTAGSEDPNRVQFEPDRLYRIDMFPAQSGTGYESSSFYTFVPKYCTAGSSIFCPKGYTDPDVVFFITSDAARTYPEQLANPNGYGGSTPVESYFPDNQWVLPYDFRKICASSGCTSPNSDDAYVFVTPAPLPGSGPSALPVQLTAASDADWRIPASKTYNWSSADVSAILFGPSGKLTANGSLNMSGVTLTASNPSQGWRGVQFNPYSSGTISASSLIEKVGGGPTASVRIDGASVTIQNSEIRNSVGSQVDGVYATNLSDVLYLRGNRIHDLSGSGLATYSAGKTSVSSNSIYANTGNGVSDFYFADSEYAKNRIGHQNNSALGNGGNGLEVYTGGYAAFHGYTASGYTNGGNVIARNHTGGLDASSYSTVDGGDAYGDFHNSLYLNGQADPGFVQDGVGPDARSYWQALTYAQRNWWGRPVNPDTTTCGTLPLAQCGSPYNRGILYVAPMLSYDPNVSGSGARAAPGMGQESGSEAESKTPFDAFRAAQVAGKTAEAVEHLRAIVGAGGRGPTVGAALAAAARLCATEPEAAVLLTSVSQERAGTERALWASSALATCYVAAGRETDALAATEALVAAGVAARSTGANETELGTALFGHLLAVGLHLSRGDDAAAEASLAAAHALAPTDRKVAQVARVVALETGTKVAWLEPGVEVAGRAGTAARRATEIESVTSDVTMLLAPRPNPSRGTATVPFTLAEPSAVRLSVYDALGREVAVLADGSLPAGPHAATFDGTALPVGLYLARLNVDSAGGSRAVYSQRLTVLR